MHTDLKRKISPKNMIALFEMPEKINIRWYEQLNPSEVTNDTDKVYYKLTIRHNEDENPRKLLTKALKSLVKSKV